MNHETVDRVAAHTRSDINEQIRRQIEVNVLHCARRLDKIEDRLHQLDREWDIERTLETNASSIILAGLVLSLFNRKWLVAPMLISGFLLQHAVQGWCPPILILRRLGVRTMQEIDEERYALKALRGDFNHVNDGSSDGDPFAKADRAMDAATY